VQILCSSIWISPDSLIKARDSGGLDILEVALSFSNRDFIYSYLTAPLSLAFFFAMFFPSPPLVWISLLLLFPLKFQSLLWFYFLFLTPLSLIRIIFCCTLPSFRHSHSFPSVHILLNFCWPMLILYCTSGLNQICGIILLYSSSRNHMYVFPYRHKEAKANFTLLLLFTVNI
jgi:hypothetical protein